MATGYTAALQDGKEKNFESFALRCARAFGALIEMRDSPMDAPIPDEFSPSDYHQRRLEEDRGELAILRALTPAVAERRARGTYAAAMAEWERGQTERRTVKARYEAMLADVVAWVPPTPDHIGLKTFMVEQLQESIRFDCATGDEDRWKPKRQDGPAWLAEQIARVERSIAYHEEEHGKDVARSHERSEWVRQLRRSLASHPEPATR